MLRDKEASAARTWDSRMSVRETWGPSTSTLSPSWEDLAADRGSWRNTLHKQLNLGEEKLIAMVDEQRAREKDSINRPVTLHQFHFCYWDCHSQIGLLSHMRRCSSRVDSLVCSTGFNYNSFWRNFPARAKQIGSVNTTTSHLHLGQWLLYINNKSHNGAHYGSS